MTWLRNFSGSTLILIFLSSCSVAVPDIPVCTELHPSRGYCVYTLSSKEFEVSDTQLMEGKTWWDMRASMIYLPTQSWVKLKAFVIKICTKTDKCDTDLGSWDRTVDLIDEKLVKKE